jgi:hypothetical protein
MKLSNYFQLRKILEIQPFQSSFLTLKTVLYYFSFLGNLFLILFGFFFIKNVTDSIPYLFPNQSIVFGIFVGLFLTGYELFKRYTLEQFIISVLKVRKITISLFLGLIVSMGLIAGSFYLSLNGAHRLVDSSEKIVATIDQNISIKADSISKYYDTEIAYYRAQPARTRTDRKYRDSLVNALQQTKDQKLLAVESKTADKSQSTLEKNKENDTAFVFMTFFLEFIIVLGVAFNAIYTIGSYEETKKLLSTPKYKQAELNLTLLKLYYQNGKKQPGDPVLSLSKMLSLVKNQKVNCAQTEVKNFVVYCSELDITKEVRARRKEYQVDYATAKSLIEKELVL